MEGVAIRSHIKEQTEGEQASSSLIGKQTANNIKPKICKIKTEYSGGSSPNVVLDCQKSISKYVSSYYQSLYDETVTDKGKQDWFLSFVDKCVSENDNNALIAQISDEEIYFTLKSFNNNKSPGIDGLPVEFYVRFFHIIRDELCSMIRNSLDIGKLTLSQRKAILILLFKGGDCELLSSWRPISLICVDTKIISKILANRIKPLMNQCISKEQYCSNDKSITECNNVTRDMIYFINDKNETGALINVDLQKAFDSVDHSFLFAVMRKMGFCLKFISLIKTLYNDILSTCLVNGHLSNQFDIKRGVRQGCPLSMILYVFSQEPLYRAFKATNQIQTFNIPCRNIKMLGFADDTSLFVNSDLSLISIFNILNYFGMASGIKVNTKKTRILGFGAWKYRTDWPIPDLKTEKSEIKILGILFCRDINQAIELNWNKVLSNIKVMIRILSARRLTLYQRAIVINSFLLSKVWYIAHTYPLPKKYSDSITTEIFKYLWQSKSNPIKRDVVYQIKSKGGLGIFNVFLKAKCILTSTFLKQFLSSQENDSFLKYYCSIRINPIFNIRDLPINVTYVCPWYLMK